jgi:transitional endoplasmic reticulum ATPase
MGHLQESALVNTFNSFKETFSGHRASPRLAILESLRQRFPDYHVTCTGPRTEYDFKGYAKKVGKATIDQVFVENDCEPYEALRKYSAPARRLDKEPGVLYDQTFFGRYKLVWQEHEFILFRTTWLTTCWGQEEKHWYILTPKDAGTIDEAGHHSLTDELLLEVGKWTSDVHEEIYVFDDSEWQKSHDLWKAVRDSSWDDVIMDAKVKQDLIENVQGFFDNRELYRKYSVGWRRGIILHGVPGNGKTISIKALMQYLSKLEEPIPSLYVKSLQNKCDMPQWSVAAIFEKARKMAPCLLVFEDLDSLIVDKVRSYFLNEVDGLESNDGILMIGSTNHLNRLDPAISKRPSRFDRKYHFRVPSRENRIAYCHYWRAKLLANDEFDFPEDVCEVIADITEGFSYAYMKELIVMALLTVARGGKGIDETSETGWDVVSDTSTPAEPVDGKADEKTADGEKKDDEKKNAKKARETPVVHVPEHLKENVFLRVVQQQTKILLHEMDNTEEEENALPLLSGDGSESSRPACLKCEA